LSEALYEGRPADRGLVPAALVLGALAARAKPQTVQALKSLGKEAGASDPSGSSLSEEARRQISAAVAYAMKGGGL
jgi:hypothetical protein